MAEKEYIERGAAIESIRLTYCKECNSYNGVRCRACEFDDAMSMIEDVPAADVVEVVLCKDCKHYGTSRCAMDTYAFDVVEEGFCSYGERKTTGGDN